MHTQHHDPIGLFLSHFRECVDVIVLFLNDLYVDFQVHSSAFRSVRQSHGTLTADSLIPRAGVPLQN